METAAAGDCTESHYPRFNSSRYPERMTKLLLEHNKGTFIIFLKALPRLKRYFNLRLKEKFQQSMVKLIKIGPDERDPIS